MLALGDNLSQSLVSFRSHRLRAILTILGLTMGVATLITVMTIVQGANVYVERKIANLGTHVFQMARTPFTVTDFNAIIKSLRYKHLTIEDVRAVAERCPDCQLVGASVTTSVHLRSQNHELEDTELLGHTPNMGDIDTRTVEQGRYFTDAEDQRGSNVCLIGDTVNQEFFLGANPIGKSVRTNNAEFTVLGTMEKIGTVLGQNRDNFVIIPMNTYLRTRGSRSSITINALVGGDQVQFDRAQDQARLALRARRHISGNQEEDFFIGTKETYMSLWRSISGAFFLVFLMVSSISAVVGGVVIMNVMLVSVTERTKEIGVRRAVGATQQDILRQFLAESVLQCLLGGIAGIACGFACALLLKSLTAFPADVETWVAILGVLLSSAIGLFFGIYPAVIASRLDPVVALRSD